MKFIFQQQFNEVLLRSEKKRTTILIGIFTFAICLQTVNFLFLEQTGMITKEMSSFTTIWLFPVTLTLFELMSLLFIKKRMKAVKKQVPLGFQYLNVSLEICFPTLIMAFVAREYPSVNVLQSPGVFVYFIFIILSTLRLNFWLSLYCGLLASVSYTFFSIFLYAHFSSDDGVKAIVLVLSGMAAGFVARQVRSGINYSLRESEKRHQVENLFGRQISMEIAEKMLENNGKIESKRMHVAIMFIDIRNFTLFATDRTPEEIVQYQNAFFRIVINTVARYHGVVHQFLGDGCMVTFGAPLPLDNPSEDAVHAAMELLSEVKKAGENGELIDTRIGVGIHSGEVITGNIGTEYRQQYSVTGQVVIMASRIEQLNKQFGTQLLISEDVFRSIGTPNLKAEGQEEVVLKGWNEAIRIYKIL